jgi:hypothetical protein
MRRPVGPLVVSTVWLELAAAPVPDRSDIDVCEQAASASAATEENSTREGRIGILLGLFMGMPND